MVNSVGFFGHMLQINPLNRNFQTIPRRFDGLCIRDIGYVPRKNEQVDWVFPTFNYSLILSGRGFYRSDGQVIEITAPCVITQSPGQPTGYGPPLGESWEELYFVLPPEKEALVNSRRLIGDDPQHWIIRNPGGATTAIRALFAMLESPDRFAGKADLIDNLAERIIIETLLPGEESSDAGFDAVKKLAQEMTTYPEQSYDYQEFARDFGLSYSTFQRRWREVHDVPPGQYLLSLRISECCRLMAETDMKITEIGRSMGFEDTAYYSRIFKQRIGMSPSQYRSMRQPHKKD